MVPPIRAVGKQRKFPKEKRGMASGNGLPSSSALVAKSPSALGPFPRYIWVHQDTPQDSLDETCHEIWKRVQSLPEALQPRTSKDQLSGPMAGTPRDNGLSLHEEALELSSDKDEISLLVEQEFLSLTKEHHVLVTESLGEPEAPSSSPKEPRQPAPCLLMPPVVAGSSDCSGASAIAGDKLPEPKGAMSAIGSRQDCDSALSAVTNILQATKIKNAKGREDRGHSLGACNSEISKLLAQLPLKPKEMFKAPDSKMMLEETRVIKDFLQNSMFSGPRPREPGAMGPFLLMPPPPPPAPSNKQPKLPAQKRQLPVFAKICSKSETGRALESHNLLERNPGTKEPTKGQESFFLSQWPQNQKDTCDNPPVTVADKNHLKYTGSVFTPRFATNLNSASVNQPLWLNLNYPPPAVFTNHSTYPQYQGLYPQRAPRMSYQQALQPQLGCFSRQVTPCNPQQMGQQVLRPSYTPMMNYVPLVQPNYPYRQRTPPKLSTNPRDPPPMAGDGPQFLFPQPYGFGSTSGGPLMNSPYFSSSGNGINF